MEDIRLKNQCIKETNEHKDKVHDFIDKIIKELKQRAKEHDQSKLQNPELGIFSKVTPRLKTLTYGSYEYKKSLEEMGPALEHHYQENKHHPEHFENGIKDMNLVDIVEMFCDWYAATMRHDNGDINKSIEINKGRFNYSEDLEKIFKNTIDVLK